MGEPCPLTSETRRKPPSSPREFFAKLYEESKPLQTENTHGKMVPRIAETPVPEIPFGLSALLWPPSFAAATAQFQWNLIHNYRSTGINGVNSREEILQPSLQDAPTPESALPHFNIPPAFNNFLARKRRRDGRIRRQRTTFSSDQTVSLEIEFQRTEYISRSRRCELAQRLGLSETQIKIWFQNRRAKDKRLEKAQVDQQVFNLLTNCYQA